MRVAGVPVGKVRKVEVGDGTNRTVATIEIERRFAPLRTDARAVLRQKTLLGETYVEMTPGRSKETIPEGGQLPDGQVKDTVQLDEIFDSLDPADARGVPRLAEGPGQGHRRPRPGLQRRARHAAGLRPRRRRRARGARLPGGGGDAAGQEHRRGVRRAHQERGAAAEPDHRRQAHVRRDGVEERRAGRDDPDLPDLPRRVQADARARAALLARHRPADHRPAPGRPRPASRRCAT